MDILVGRRAGAIDDDELTARIAGAERVVVDVGTGDGRAAVRAARRHPGWLVIGIDPAADRMAAASTSAARKPERGGTANVLFTVARIEEPPAVLTGTAHEVRVQLPWSSLLRGVVRGDGPVLRGLRRILRHDGELVVVVGTDIWRPPVPREIEGLEPLTAGAVDGPLARRYRDAGLSIVSSESQDAAGAAAAFGDDPGDDPRHSSWGRRIDAAHGRAGFVVLRAVPAR